MEHGIRNNTFLELSLQVLTIERGENCIVHRKKEGGIREDEMMGL